MKCRILRASDDYELNVRHTDEIAEAEGMTDQQICRMEAELKQVGRYWLNADTYVVPVRSGQ
jgi:hypothetical protein